jgi:hypothetical protein
MTCQKVKTIDKNCVYLHGREITHISEVERIEAKVNSKNKG